MDLKADILQTLRKHIFSENRVITEDIEPEVIAHVDIDPVRATMQGNVENRKFGIAVIGYEMAGTRGSITPDNMQEFDGGMEFVSRDGGFWDLPEDELKKYRADFVPTSIGDIPQMLPDYLGLSYEDGGLKSVWGSDDEEPEFGGGGISRTGNRMQNAPDNIEDTDTDAVDLELMLQDVEEKLQDRALTGPRKQELNDYKALILQKKAKLNEDVNDSDDSTDADTSSDLVKVFDLPSKQWVEVPVSELPRPRPVGSFGYLKLQRDAEGSYRPYRRRLPEVFADPRVDKGYDQLHKIKTPWMLFMDWFYLALENIQMPPEWNKCHEKDTRCRGLSLKSKRSELLYGTIAERGGKMSAFAEGLKQRILKLNAEAEAAKKAGRRADVGRIVDEVHNLNSQYALLKRYGLLGVGSNERKERDFTKPPFPKGRHPRKYPTRWSDDVDKLNMQPQRHIMGPQSQSEYAKYTAELSTELDDPTIFDTGKKTVGTDIDLMRLRAHDLKKSRGVDRHLTYGRTTPAKNNRAEKIARIKQAFGKLSAYRAEQAKQRGMREAAGDDFEDVLTPPVSTSAKRERIHPTNPAVDYKTHCPDCIFPASKYGHDMFYGMTRGHSREIIEDDAYDIIFRMPNLTSEPTMRGKSAVMISAAKNFLALLTQFGIPKWLDVSIDDKIWTDNDIESDVPATLAGKPVSRTFGRITFKTKVRQPGLVPGHETTEHDPSKLDIMDPEYERKFKDAESAIVGARTGRTSTDRSNDPAPVGKLTLPNVTADASGTLRLGDLSKFKVLDARKLASSDQKVRDRAYQDIKKDIRNWFDKGSMGGARMHNMSGRSSAARGVKTQQFREKQVTELMKLVDEIKDKSRAWIRINGIPMSFMEGDILEVLSAQFKKMSVDLDPSQITIEALQQISKNVRDRVVNLLRRAADNPAFYLGGMLESIQRLAAANESGDLYAIKAAQLLVEEASENIPECTTEVEEDIVALLQYRGYCRYARNLLRENVDLHAVALALRGYDATTVDSFLEPHELSEVVTLRAAVISESVKPLVSQALQILSTESYERTLPLFKRVVSKLGLADMPYLPLIMPQRIINNGIIEDSPLESVLNDIGYSYGMLTANSNNGSVTNIWNKLGNL